MISLRTFSLLSCLGYTLLACSSDSSPNTPADGGTAGSAGRTTASAGSAGASAGAGGANAGTGGSATAGQPSAGSAGATTASGKACLDTKSLGGDPFLCITLEADASEEDVQTACGGFDGVDACPSEGVTYRCDDSRIVGTRIPANVVYYIASKPASDEAVTNNCEAREGTYVKL